MQITVAKYDFCKSIHRNCLAMKEVECLCYWFPISSWKNSEAESLKPDPSGVARSCMVSCFLEEKKSSESENMTTRFLWISPSFHEHAALHLVFQFLMQCMNSECLEMHPRDYIMHMQCILYEWEEAWRISSFAHAADIYDNQGRHTSHSIKHVVAHSYLE